MNAQAPYGAALLRISLGIIFLAHSAYLKLVVFTVPGTVGFFESLGLPALVAYGTIGAEIIGGTLLILGVLFFMGMPKQLWWAIAAFIAGGAIVGGVAVSMIDITDLSDRYAEEWRSNSLSAVGDIITTQTDIGLFVAGAGGVLGVLAAPFVNRS